MRRQLPALVARFDERLTPAEPDKIEGIVAYLAMGFPSQRLSDAEAEARLAIYVEGLSDLPEEVLQEAARAAVRKCKFYPTVKELRDLAWPHFNRLQWPGVVLRSLIMKHDNEWREPIPEGQRVRPEQLRSLAKRLERFNSKRSKAEKANAA